MLLVRLTGGRLAEVFFGIGYEGSGSLCDALHPFFSFGGSPTPKGDPHLDVRIRVWSHGGHANTILSISGKRMPENMALEDWSKRGSYVLDPSGSPIDIEFRLLPIPTGAAVQYSVGDKLDLDLQMSRNWIKKIQLPVVS